MITTGHHRTWFFVFEVMTGEVYPNDTGIRFTEIVNSRRTLNHISERFYSLKAITFQGIEEVGYQTTTDPTIESEADAIVRVDLAGVCGSDLHVYHGRETGLDEETILGHEFVGQIEAVGQKVARFKPGDRVVSPFTTNCGDCFYCLEGLTARCVRGQLFGWREAGQGLHGAQAQYVRVPLADTTLVAIPEEVTPEEALLAGDVFSTGFFAATAGEVGPGDVVAVLGCGPVGLMAALSARLLGAERVFALDRIEERLALARDFGVEAVNFENQSPKDVVAEATESRGADVVLEAVGSQKASRLAVDLVRPGGVVSVVGVHTEPSFDFSPVLAYDKNLTYRIGRCSARHFLDRTLELLSSNKPPISRIISHRLPLADGAHAYRIFANRTEGCTKAVLIP